VRAVDWISETEISAMAASCGRDRPTQRYLRLLLLAVPSQLEALCSHGYINQTSATLSLEIQKQHVDYLDPRDDRLLRKVHRIGRGFDLKSLTADPQRTAKVFDRLSRRWEEYVAASQYHGVFSWLVRCAGTLSSSLRCGGHFLDLACGVGLMGQTLRLTRVEAPIIGADISWGMLTRAQARGCYDALLRANANMTLPLSDRSVDVAMCIGSIELLRLDIVLQECSRVVKPGGVLWVSFQHDDDTTLNPTLHQHIYGLTEESMLRSLKNCCFDLIDAEKCPNAFLTPSPGGVMQPVPYLFVRAERRSA
jgi:ubiquinone/menaquinone biosynthesis C-methylase UbiE